MGRPYLEHTFGHNWDSHKKIIQLRGTALDNKNKIQHNSAYHTFLIYKFS